MYTALVKVGFFQFETCFKVVYKSKWDVSCQNMIEQTLYNVNKSKTINCIVFDFLTMIKMTYADVSPVISRSSQRLCNPLVRAGHIIIYGTLIAEPIMNSLMGESLGRS